MIANKVVCRINDVPDGICCFSLEVLEPDKLKVGVPPPGPATLEMLPVAPVLDLAVHGELEKVLEGRAAHLRGDDGLMELVETHQAVLWVSAHVHH